MNTPNLMQDVQAIEQAEQANAQSQYAAILHRHSNPKPSDAADLHRLAKALGKSAKDIQTDYNVILAAGSQMKTVEAVPPDIRDELMEKEREVVQAGQKEKEAKAAFTLAQQQRNMTRERVSMREAAKEKLRGIRSAHPELFPPMVSTNDSGD